MRLNWLISILVGAAVTFVVAGVDCGDAQGLDPVRCYPAIDGIGTGHGILGRGTANARLAARSNWRVAAADQYGPTYDRFYMARDVRWSCNKLAILTAKCVVVAKPCGPPR